MLARIHTPHLGMDDAEDWVLLASLWQQKFIINRTNFSCDLVRPLPVCKETLTVIKEPFDLEQKTFLGMLGYTPASAAPVPSPWGMGQLLQLIQLFSHLEHVRENIQSLLWSLSLPRLLQDIQRPSNLAAIKQLNGGKSC